MLVFIKNVSGSQKVWNGKTIENNEFYQIPSIDVVSWANNSQVLVAITSGEAIIAKDNSDTTNFSDVNLAINYLKGVPNDQDPSGRDIIRIASTRKGWHYQAHSVQFNINTLNSIYNKDDEGNDLGFATIKVYKANGDECTTQLDADSNGCKTVVTWAPDFDFEVISGNIRQETKESVNSYMYVNAMVPTGLAAPNDFAKIPFTQGGINLKYIGADELLKTDGRSAKLLPGASGAHMKVIINYQAGILLPNAHEMSIIFEMYKDPMS